MFSHKMTNRIVLALCLFFAMTLGALILIARDQTEQIFDRLAIDRVIASHNGFINYLEDLSERAMLRAVVMAHQDRLIHAIERYEENDFVLTDENYEELLRIANDYIYGYDFISITDSKGIALARTDNGERDYPLPKNGYDLTANPDVRLVFETGEPVTSLTFMLDNTTLVATALYPIYNGEKLLGIITCLYDMTNPKYLNAYKEQSGSEVAIFLDDQEFISTMATGNEPVRLQPADVVIEAIFQEQKDLHIEYFEFGGVIYATGFAPLIYHDRIIGMIFTGVDVHTAMDTRTYMFALFLFIAGLGIVIAIVSMIALQGLSSLNKKQINLQNTMTRLSQEFLSDEDIDTVISNAFSEMAPLMRVSQILLYRVKPGNPDVFICSNEWRSPALGKSTRIGDELTVSAEMRQAFESLGDSSKFYISSEDKDLKEVLEPYRVDFRNYLTTTIYINEKPFAVVDFARVKNNLKWRKADINAASFISNILASAFHRKIVEQQLVDAKNLAEQSSQYKSAFLANVSHEIRTPMNAILGIAEIYMQDPSSRKNIDEGLSMIYDSGNLLLGIVNDILDLSKIEAGKMEILPGKYDIPSLINDSVQVCRMRYGSKPIEFNLDIDKNTPLNLIGDAMRIKQVLNNILSNAFKYTDSGEVRMFVSANKEEISDPSAADREIIDDDVMLIFRVSDTGQGMSPDQLELLYDEFTRFNVESNKTTVGTGLGMSITKRLVDLMGGEINVVSDVGKGTTFTVHIPQKRLDTMTCGPEMTERLNSFSYHSLSLSKKKQIICEYMPYGSVLVVDDVESNLYVAKGMLIPYGLKIETATSGYEAIDCVAGGKSYDVIFMDHMMPKMDGIETVKNLREMGYTGYIIALTANALVGQAEIFLDNGFDAYIPKPIDSRELNAVLNAFIRNKKPPEVVNAAREEAREAELLRSLEAAGGGSGGNTGSAGTDEDDDDDELDDVMALFVLDAERAAATLEKEYKNLTETGKIDIDMYRISAHGMKSALRHIGNNEMSEYSYSLEEAALAEDYDTIIEKTPKLISTLKTIIDQYSN